MPVRILVQAIRKIRNKNNPVVKLSTQLMEKMAKKRVSLFSEYVRNRQVLDVGVGTGQISKCLQGLGCKVKGIDVDDTCLYTNLDYSIYDGTHIPFPNKSFDVGVLICVLHHCNQPIRVLSETMRTCKRVVILEDTYRNGFEKALVSARDCVGNFEFYMHKYRKSEEWEKVFDRKNWQVIKKYEWSNITFYGMYGRQTLFVIEHK